MHKKSSKRIQFMKFSIISLIATFTIFLIPNITNSAPIISGSDAIRTLGQYLNIDTNPTPVLESSGIRNSSFPNSFGFYTPSAVVIDTIDKRLYVGDFNAQRVLVFNLNSDYSLVDREADFVLGQDNFTERDYSIESEKRVQGIYGLALDEAGRRLFVADSTSNRVLVFDVSSITNGESAIAVLGQPDFSATSTTLSDAGMSDPYGMVFDSVRQWLYVADGAYNRVTVYDVNAITNGESAIHVLGQPDFATSSERLTQDGLKTPRSVALDVAGDRLFVGQADRISVFDVASITNGENAVNILANTSYTSAAGGIGSTTQSNIYGIAYDATRNYLYASSLFTQRIHIYDTAVINDGEPAINILGQGNFTSNISYGTAGIIASSTAIVYGIAQVGDKLFVSNGASDVSRVLIFDIGTIENGESAIEVIGQSPSIYTRGQPSFTIGSVFNTPVNALGFNNPGDIEKDRVNHRLFVTDSSNNRILVFNLNENNVLVDYTADYVLGQPSFASTTASTTQTGLNSPQGIKFDEDSNRLFVADFNNHRVIIYDTAVIENGEPAIYVIGQPGFTTATAATSQLTGRNPTDIEYDSVTGRLFVSQNGSHKVAIYNIADGIVNGENAIGVLGSAGYGATINTATQSSVPGASGLAFDAANNRLFVSNSISTNNRPRIMVFDVATTTNGQNATFVLGQPDFTSFTASRTATGLTRPSFLSFDPVNNRLFASDESDFRVLVYDVTSITNGEPATHVLGQPDFTSRNLYSPDYPAHAIPSAKSIFYDTDTEELYVSQGFTGRISIFAAGPPDVVAPTTTQVSVVAGGTSLSVEFDEVLDSGSIPATSDFELTVDGATTNVSISSISVSSSTVSLSLSSTIYQGQVVSLSYSSTTNSIRDLSSNIADNFTNLIVTNNSTQTVSAPTPTPTSSGGGSGGGGSRISTPLPTVVSSVLPPASANAVIFTRDLTLTAQGTDVYALQRFLNARGHTVANTGAGSPGNETSIFGSLTRLALARFQTSVGITPATGYFGPLTRAFINKLGATPPKPATAQTTPTVSSPTTITTPTTYTRDLTLESTGSDVTALQTYLIQQGYLQSGYATGYFGVLTQSALIKFQQANNITPALGYFGPKTRGVVEGR